MGLLFPCAPAAGASPLPLPRLSTRALVVLRARVRPGIRIVHADLTVENIDTIDQVWCELWADDVEPGAPAGPASWHRLDRDDVTIGERPAATTRDTLHLETTVVSVQRFNVRIRCGHRMTGTAPLVLPGARLAVHDAADPDNSDAAMTAPATVPGKAATTAKKPTAKKPTAGAGAAPKRPAVTSVPQAPRPTTRTTAARASSARTTP